MNVSSLCLCLSNALAVKHMKSSSLVYTFDNNNNRKKQQIEQQQKVKKGKKKRNGPPNQEAWDLLVLSRLCCLLHHDCERGLLFIITLRTAFKTFKSCVLFCCFFRWGIHFLLFPFSRFFFWGGFEMFCLLCSPTSRWTCTRVSAIKWPSTRQRQYARSESKCGYIPFIFLFLFWFLVVLMDGIHWEFTATSEWVWSITNWRGL